MGFIQALQSKKGKKFMGYLYGWGAAIVIVGAMFKIQHWPGAGPMLVAGLTIEAIIFFFSAFEPIHEEIDWSLVYPELAHGHDGDHEHGEHAHETKKIGNEDSVSQELDRLLTEAKIGPELIESLGTGLRALGDNTSKLADITDASVASNEFANNIKTASRTVENLTDTYSKANETVAGSVEELSRSYTKASQALDAISASTEGSASYGEQLTNVSKNLEALNRVYELQLQGSNEHMELTKQLHAGFDEMMRNLKDSLDDTRKYKEEIGQLANNLSALNTVYGNMLTAMNFQGNRSHGA